MFSNTTCTFQPYMLLPLPPLPNVPTLIYEPQKLGLFLCELSFCQGDTVWISLCIMHKKGSISDILPRTNMEDHEQVNDLLKQPKKLRQEAIRISHKKAKLN
ncbi:hypothetical protein Dimus_035896 [Dionaea muscipula]